MGLSGLGVFLGKVAFGQMEHYTKIPAKTQKKLLMKIIRKNRNTEYGKKYGFSEIKSLEDFQKKVPLTTYKDYEEYVDREVQNGEKKLLTANYVVRYCSSSGSVGKPKILPKTAPDLWVMQCLGFSSSVACSYNYFKERGIKFNEQRGPLVMVLTGHPLENGKMCNGAGQIPLSYLKPIIHTFSPTPLDVLFPEHEEDFDISYIQLRFALVDKKVSYIGSLVVTLLTTMFDYLESNWEILCNDIEKGTIDPGIKMPEDIRKKFLKKLKPDPERAAELRREFEKGFDTPIAPRIWPRLQWAYSMVGSNLEIYVEKLRRSIGDIPIHNMGYAAAEGFFAVPVELNVNDSSLVPYSVFFEFLPVDAPEGATPLTMDKLEVGKEYEIIVTNRSGLYRYRLEDVVKVTGMFNKTPRVEFVYRLNLGMNIANEKTSTQMLDWCVKQICEKKDITAEGHSFYSDYSTTPPHYVMLIEPTTPVDASESESYAQILDDCMKECNEKYFKYRRWGMIDDPEVLFLKPGTYNDYRQMLFDRGVILNQVKPVTVINTDERKEFFFSHTI